MADTELIAQTNSLLQRFFDMRQEEKANAEKMRTDMEADRAKWDEDFQTGLKEKLSERGASLDGFDGTMEDWESRMKAVQAQAKERLEVEKAKEREYKDQMLEEMRTQSELLRRIAERLEA